MSSERYLDVSDLDPPEPLERILDELDRNQPGDYLRVLHRREPWPLFSILEEQGYRYHMRGVDNGFEIFIWRHDDAAAEQAVREQLE